MSALKALLLLCVIIYQVLHAEGSPIQDPSIADPELSDQQHALLQLTVSLHTAVNSFYDYFSYLHVTPKPGRNESNVVDTLPSTSTMKSTVQISTVPSESDTHLNLKQNPTEDASKPEKEDLASSENELEQEHNDSKMVQYIKGYNRRFVLSDESSSEEDTQKAASDKAKIENPELVSEEKVVDQKIVDVQQDEDDELPEDQQSDEQKLTEEQASEIQKIIAEQNSEDQKIIIEQNLEDQKIINEQNLEDQNRVVDQNLENQEQQSQTSKKKQLNDQEITIYSEDTNQQFEQVSDDQIDDKQLVEAGITSQTTEPTNKQHLAERQGSQETSSVTAVYQTTENLEYPIRRSEQNKQPETNDGTTTERIEENYEHPAGQSHHLEHNLKGETDSSQIQVTTVHLEQSSKGLGDVGQTEIVYLAGQTNPGTSAERTAAETINKQDEQNNNAGKKTEATAVDEGEKHESKSQNKETIEDGELEAKILQEVQALEEKNTILDTIEANERNQPESINADLENDGVEKQSNEQQETGIAQLVEEKQLVQNEDQSEDARNHSEQEIEQSAKTVVENSELKREGLYEILADAAHNKESNQIPNAAQVELKQESYQHLEDGHAHLNDILEEPHESQVASRDTASSPQAANNEATVAPSLYQTGHVQTDSKLVVPEFREITNPASIADTTPCDVASEQFEENNNPSRSNFDNLEETPTVSAKTMQQQSDESGASIGDEKMPQYLDGNIILNDNLKTHEHLEEILQQQSAEVKVPQYLDENVVFDGNPKTQEHFETSVMPRYSKESINLAANYQIEETTVNVDKLKTSTQMPHDDLHEDLKTELTKPDTSQLVKVDAEEEDENEDTDSKSSEDETGQRIIDAIISEISKEESAEDDAKLKNATTKQEQHENDQEEGDSQIKNELQSTTDKSAENENKQAVELKTFVLEQLAKQDDEPLKTILLEETPEDEESADKSLENEEEEQPNNTNQNTTLPERKQAENDSDEDDISNQSAFVRMDLSNVKSDEQNSDDDEPSTNIDYHGDDRSSYDKVHIVELGDEYEPVQRIEIQRTRKQKERMLTSLERNLVQQLVNIILEVNKAKNRVATKRYAMHNPSVRHGSSEQMPMNYSPLHLQKPVDVQKV